MSADGGPVVTKVQRDGATRAFGLSRRDLLKRGAVAGSIVWAAPVIDSFTSRAGATVSKPPGGVNFGCSWSYIVWKNTTTGAIGYTGWQGDTNTGCNSNAADPPAHGPSSITCPPGATSNFNSFTLNNGTPVPSVDYTLAGGQSGTLTSPTDNCASFAYIGCNGRTVVADSHTQILAVFSFGGGTITAGCPATANAGNQITIACAGQTGC